MKNKLMLKHKMRLIVFISIFVLLNLGLYIKTVPQEEAHLYLHKEVIQEDFDEYFYVIAKNGDTIWNIVKSNYELIEKTQNIDFRDVISITIDLNGGSELSIGQSVKLPKNVK